MEDERDISTRKLIARLGLRILIIILSLIALFIFFGPFLKYLLPFVIAYIVSALLLMPVIKRLSGKYKHLRKIWSIILVIAIMCMAIIAIVGIVYYIAKQGMELVKNREVYMQSMYNVINELADFVASRTSLKQEQLMEVVDQLIAKLSIWIKHDLPGMTPELINQISNYAPTIGSVLLASLFFLMATYFICSDFPVINAKLKSFIPHGIRPYLKQIKDAAGSATFGYFRAQLIVSSLVALIALVVFCIVGQSYAVLFALLVGIVDFIPLLGSSVILAPWIVVLVVSGNYTKAIIYAVLTFALFLFRRIVEPKIVGNQTGLHPLVSLISLFVGIKMGGIFGMILAPIVCMAVIGLGKTGFFTPTFNDIRLLSQRMAEYTGMIDGCKREDEKDEKKDA